MSVVLVTGGRDFADSLLVADALSDLLPEDVVIHGGASGADTLAGQVAEEMGLHVAVVCARWRFYGRSAGHLRNRAMLALRPDRVIAFPGGKGTADCCNQAEAAGIPVEHWKP